MKESIQEKEEVFCQILCVSINNMTNDGYIPGYEWGQ
jgi:hypothetical protein